MSEKKSFTRTELKLLLFARQQLVILQLPRPSDTKSEYCRFLGVSFLCSCRKIFSTQDTVHFNEHAMFQRACMMSEETKFCFCARSA